MKDNMFECPECGTGTPFDDLEFDLKEAATLTCPVCKSVIELSGMLVEPGTVPGEVPNEMEPPEEMGPEDEMEPEMEPGEEEGGPVVPSGGTEPEQITPKGESLQSRVDKAFKDLDEGKDVHEVLGSLLGQKPLKLASPKKIKMGSGESTSEGRKTVDLTPSPSQYRHMLQIIVNNSKSRADKAWAKDELERIKGVKSWRMPVGEGPKDRYHGEPYKEEPPEPVGKDRWHGERKNLKEGRYPDGWDIGSGLSFEDEMGNFIYFAPEGFVEVGKGDKWEYQFFPDEVTVQESKHSSEKTIKEKSEEQPEDWKGDFATFNSKFFGVIQDLNIPMEDFDAVLRAIQDNDGIKLNNDKVELDLKKVRTTLLDFLNNQAQQAGAEVAATNNLSEPPPSAPDLGNEVPEQPAEQPAEQPPMESLKVQDEDAGQDDLEAKVDEVIMKYFA